MVSYERGISTYADVYAAIWTQVQRLISTELRAKVRSELNFKK